MFASSLGPSSQACYTLAQGPCQDKFGGLVLMASH